MALAAMDSESGCLPLDYLQGHKDGLEWASQLAEANHPETGDWLYDDPIELAKAIRKGPDMQPVQPVADSEPVIVVGDDGGDALSYRRLIQSFEPGTKLYRHAQPAPAVPGKWIPVSERMPEKGQAVLVYRPKAHEGGDSDVRVAVYGRHNFEHGFGCYWEPSHWMPLPAAPQEVKP
ncbi:Eaa1 [Klebsiella quasipneumoniae]|uniref:Eaa1 n=2 Tax=Klebsiella quasipneumoniae TaxID=1463165 RepID=A0ABD7N1U3_9ENTR|nr:Eaa1 [Klebsiella quasipneumoniae]